MNETIWTTSRRVAEVVGGTHYGPTHNVNGIWNVDEATRQEVAFWDKDTDWHTDAGTLICLPKFGMRVTNRSLIIHPNPRQAALLAAEFLHPDWDRGDPARHVVNWEGVTRAGSHLSIGGPGHGYEMVAGVWRRMPHIGKVVFGNDIQLGSHVNIDRGVFSHTTIGSGTVIDAHVHVAHNCSIGPNNFIAAGTIFSGSVTTGSDVWFGVNVSIMQGVTIGARAVLGTGAVVLRDVAAGETVVGHHRVIETKSKQLGVTR